MTVYLPISAKGIVFESGGVWLRRNERNEWELPGGKVDATDDQPTETVAREIQEELGLAIRVGPLIHGWRHTIPGSIDEHGGVLVLMYLCHNPVRVGPTEHVGEAGPAEIRLWPLAAIPTLSMPDFYKTAIRRAAG